MTNTVIIKRSSAPNAVPTSGQLVHGELAINYLDGNLFYKNASNNVVTIASNQFVSVTGNITGGNLSVTGNVVTGGIKTDNYMYANGQPFDTSNPAGSNTQIQYNNGDGEFGASANLTFNQATNQLTLNGQLSVAGNIIVANGISVNNSFGSAGQVLTADGSNNTYWTNQFYVGNAPPQAQSIMPNYGDIWYYISDDGQINKLYMWVTDGGSSYFYDFLPPVFP